MGIGRERGNPVTKQRKWNDEWGKSSNVFLFLGFNNLM